jgi:hypothetical protein
MLVLVAFISLIIAGLAHWMRRRELLRRSQTYAQLAERYAKAESFHEWAASLGEHLIVTFGDVRGYRTVRLEVSELRKVAQDEGFMRMQYEEAAASPLVSIQPGISELERLADVKGSPRSMSPPAFPLALDSHPMGP